MISVILCTYNPRDEYFTRCVEAIASQNFPPDQYEFFIVDNNSNPPVAGMPVVQRLGIRVVVEPKQGLTAARECGVRAAKNEVLVFVDDDNVLDKDYLGKVSGIFENSRIGAVSGEILPEYEVNPGPWFRRFEEMIAIRRFSGDREYLTTIPQYGHYFPIGAGYCVRRGVIADYFDSLDAETRIEGRTGTNLSSGEDLDIGMFVLSRGYLIGAIPRLKLLHLIPRGRVSAAYLKKLVREGTYGAFLVNKKWKKVFGMDVIPGFASSPYILLMKFLAYGCLAFLPKYQILALIQFKLLGLRIRSR